jgi:peptidoglycan/xylan/chitin deacetylase (PgdA/CDA1 family)
LAAAGLALPIGVAVAHSNQVRSDAVRPIDNDCSAGYVQFTFDDGPGIHTREVLDKLNALRIRATFFVVGKKIAEGGPAAASVLRAEMASGHSVQNHTYDHLSFTGSSTKTSPLPEAEIARQLDSTTKLMVAAGLPRPTLYRPPFGDVDVRADGVARDRGYRIVMPWGTPAANIVDSKDWSGISAQQIASNVTNGYTSGGQKFRGIRGGTIVLMHDGGYDGTRQSIAALQPIVDHMNMKHLCSTATIRDDATGGQVPPAQREPAAGNLVHNPSLERRPNPAHPVEPTCFQRAGADIGDHAARWSRTSDAHTGAFAESVHITSWRKGHQKLLLSQRTADAGCRSAARSGVRYGTWLWYKGSWQTNAPSPARVRVVTYYRQSSGSWKYWQTGPGLAPTSAWKRTHFVTAPLPKGATSISFGLTISGNGTLITDDYAMAAQ